MLLYIQYTYFNILAVAIMNVQGVQTLSQECPFLRTCFSDRWRCVYRQLRCNSRRPASLWPTGRRGSCSHRVLSPLESSWLHPQWSGGASMIAWGHPPGDMGEGLTLFEYYKLHNVHNKLGQAKWFLVSHQRQLWLMRNRIYLAGFTCTYVRDDFICCFYIHL